MLKCKCSWACHCCTLEILSHVAASYDRLIEPPVESTLDAIRILARREAILAVLLLSIVSGCAKRTPTIVFDRNFGIRLAKMTCSKQSVVESACYDPEGSVGRFDDELFVAFASSPSCSGVRVFKTPREVKSKHWQLAIHYNPGAPKQTWTMLDNVGKERGRAPAVVGEGDPKDIARAVCGIVKNAGAAVEE